MSDAGTPALERPAVRRALGISVAALFVASAVLLAIPARIIHPFRPQTANGMTLSYFAVRIAAVVVPFAALVAITATVALWRRARSHLRRAGLVLCALLLAGASYLTRQRPFEWMFNPIQRVAFARVAEVTWVEPHDDVMAVNVHGDVVAYPVRQMAYHHIVHDRGRARAGWNHGACVRSHRGRTARRVPRARRRSRAARRCAFGE